VNEPGLRSRTPRGICAAGQLYTSPMAVDPYQKAKRDHHYATDFVSLQREDIVASY
jgi:hypothetical protein